MPLPYQHRLMLVAHYRDGPGARLEWVVIDLPQPPANPDCFVRQMSANPRYVELALVVVDDVGDVYRARYFKDDKRGPAMMRAAWQHNHTDFMIALEQAIGLPLIPLQLKDWNDVYPL